MSTYTANCVHDNSSLANFQQWAQAIYTALTNFGWVQTSDTGQTDPASAASVPTSAYYYFIFKSTGPMSSSCPAFVKVYYGYNATTVCLQVQFGLGSDGAGNLTTPSNVTTNYFNSNQGIATYPCYFSGDADEFRAMLWQSGVANTGYAFGIERAKDSSGANTSTYFTCLAADSGNIGGTYWNQQSLGPAMGTSPFFGGGWTAPAVLVSLSFNSVVGAIPIIPFAGAPGNPMLGFMCAYNGDVGEGQIVTVSAYGAAHSYVVSKQGHFTYVTSGSSSGALLMRYE